MVSPRCIGAASLAIYESQIGEMTHPTFAGCW